MTQPRTRLFVYRRSVPLWLVLAVLAPLSVVVLTSLILAVAVVGVVAAVAGLVLPVFWKTRAAERVRGEPANTIELDRSQYRKLSDER